MELRPLKHGILLLSGLAALLFVVSYHTESSARGARARESTFLPLIADETIQSRDITRVDVQLPDGEPRWSYKRFDGVWRLPEFAGAFALNGEVDTLVKTLLQSRARPVGEKPRDDARFGVAPGSTLILTLYKEATQVLRLEVGALRPGVGHDERYALRGADESIYLLTSNPAVFFEDKDVPALLDKHILPRALPHGLPSRISWRGSRAVALKEISIRPLPVDSKTDAVNTMTGPKGDIEKKPTHEFIATFDSGATEILDYEHAMTFMNRTLDLEFEKIVGSISPAQGEYRAFDDPIVEVTLHYDNASPTSLAVSGALVEGKYPILNRATGQMFIVSGEKVDGLVPTFFVK
jgi:hypothetical protein